ncbi:hypothetical protein G4B88_018066, partial [Cannabis sativa]
MEIVNAPGGPSSGKAVSCVEATISLNPSASSLRALSTLCLFGRVVAPISVDADYIKQFVTKNGLKKVAVFGLDIYNLPHEYFSVDSGTLLGGLIGKVIKVELEEDKPSSWELFLRVRVEIDLESPLTSGCFFDIAPGVKRWLHFKYEKVGIFCYFCGCLGHQRRGCPLSSSSTVANLDGTPSPLFGPWLSTASRFHDVFSSVSIKKSLAPATVPVEGVGYGEGVTIVPRIAGAGVPGENDVENIVERGPRQKVKVMDRGFAGHGKGGQKKWLPKKKPAVCDRGFAEMGKKLNDNLNIGVKSPAHLPKLLPLTVGFKGDDPLVVNDGMILENPTGLEKGKKPTDTLSIGRSDGSSGPKCKCVLNGLDCIDVGSGPMGPPNSGPGLMNSKEVGEKVFMVNSLDFNARALVLEGCSQNGPAQKENVGREVIQKGIGLGNALMNGGSQLISGNEILAEPSCEEGKALSKFFKAQEVLLYDLKHFGKLDLYEIKSLGGDVGVLTTSETNERTTPFKKRKFEGSASLCTRPHKTIRTHPDVVRDFPWDTEEKDRESKVIYDDPSEEESDFMSCNEGIMKNPYEGLKVSQQRCNFPLVLSSEGLVFLIVNAPGGPSSGKAVSCVEATISLNPSASSLRALSTLCLFGRVVAPISVDADYIKQFVTKNGLKKVAVFGLDIYNLPHEYFSVDSGTLLGGLIGKVIKVELEEDKPSSWELFLRVRVEIDLESPLTSGCFFDIAPGVKRWLHFKYEKVGIFCYFCGCLGHQRRGCPLSSSSTVANLDGTPSPLFGPWLSTASRFHDVFSSVSIKKSLAPATVPVEGVGYGEGVTIVPRIAGAGVPGENDVENIVERGPRQKVKVMDRGFAGHGKGGQKKWLPKKKPAVCDRGFAEMGKKLNDNLNIGVKSPAHLPKLLPLTVGFKGDDPLVVNDDCIDVGSGPMGPPNSGPGLMNSKEVGEKVFMVNSLDFNARALVLEGCSQNGPAQKENVGREVIQKGIGLGNALMNGGSQLISGNEILAEPSCEEGKALSKFFKAQEVLLYDLKHFGKLDLYEIKSLGGDVGVLTTSETNERTTPFKKRKFEGSASLCTRPHKTIRTHPDVVRDFPWDTEEKDRESKVIYDDPSEEESDFMSCNEGIMKN